MEFMIVLRSSNTIYGTKPKHFHAMCVESVSHSRYSRTLLMDLAIKSAHYD